MNSIIVITGIMVGCDLQNCNRKEKKWMEPVLRTAGLGELDLGKGEGMSCCDWTAGNTHMLRGSVLTFSFFFIFTRLYELEIAQNRQSVRRVSS